jgi:hypothetical protein
MDYIARMRSSSPNEKEASSLLQDASYDDIENAFSEVSFEAGNLHGINRATPSWRSFT